MTHKFNQFTIIYLKANCLNSKLNREFFEIMKRKSERVFIRMTPETKADWLELCEQLPGKTQSQVFRNMIVIIDSDAELRMKLMRNDNE